MIICVYRTWAWRGKGREETRIFHPGLDIITDGERSTQRETAQGTG